MNIEELADHLARTARNIAESHFYGQKMPADVADFRDEFLRILEKYLSDQPSK